MKKKILMGACLLLLLLLVCCGYGILYTAAGSREVILEFGMFAGSNWDVENPNSYTIIDQAIQEFEEENPDIEIFILKQKL